MVTEVKPETITALKIMHRIRRIMESKCPTIEQLETKTNELTANKLPEVAIIDLQTALFFNGVAAALKLGLQDTHNIHLQ